MATRKEFQQIVTSWQGVTIGRNSTVGGTVIGDYVDAVGQRVVVVKMPKVEKKAPAKKTKRPTAKQIEQSNDPQFQGVTHGA